MSHFWGSAHSEWCLSDCGFDEGGVAVEGIGEAEHLGVGFGPVALLDGFADSGERFHTVAGVEAGSVEDVAARGLVW